MAIELKWTMDNSDLNVIGETLGFDWNDVCDEIASQELYGTDGCGYSTMSRNEYKTLTSPVLVAIFDKIFKDHPDMKYVIILDN